MEKCAGPSSRCDLQRAGDSPHSKRKFGHVWDSNHGPLDLKSATQATWPFILNNNVIRFQFDAGFELQPSFFSSLLLLS